jgi:hypothetical protein
MASATKTAVEIEIENMMQFPNPENSIYYHPTLNPFGAPPPGCPMIYRGNENFQVENLISRLVERLEFVEGIRDVKHYWT